jgi:hypothetical protein
MLDIFQSTLQNLSDKKSSTSTPEIFHKAYLNMSTSMNFKAFFLVVDYNKKPKNDQKKLSNPSGTDFLAICMLLI